MSTSTLTDADERLSALGFCCSAGKLPSRGRLTAACKSGWWELRAHRESASVPNQALLGWPGLSKVADGGAEIVFELPARVIDQAWVDAAGDDHADANTAVMALTVAWADRTMPPHDDLTGWQLPAADDVLAMLPPGAMTASAGAFVRQGELVCEPSRLALQIALIPRVPAELSPARAANLAAVLAHANARRRLVRVGLRTMPADATAALAEVDLTGVPSELLEPLVPLAAASLQAVAVELLPTVSLLSDPQVPCRLWEYAVPVSHPRTTRKGGDEA